MYLLLINYYEIIMSPSLKNIATLIGCIFCILIFNISLNAQQPSPSKSPSYSNSKLLKKSDMNDLLPSLFAFGGGLASLIGSFKLLKMKDELVKIKQSENEFLKEKYQTCKDKIQEKEQQDNEIIKSQQIRIDTLIGLGFNEKNILKKVGDLLKDDIEKCINQGKIELQENQKLSKTGNEAIKSENIQAENKIIRKNLERLENLKQSALKELEKQLQADINSAEWLNINSNTLVVNASKYVLDTTNRDFKNTINQYLDWIIFSLRKGMLIPLENTSLEPLSNLKKNHKDAFEYIEKQVPEDMHNLKFLILYLINSIR